MIRGCNNGGDNPRYIVSWSGGKDSTATIILAHIHNIPIDEIIFCEVKYSPTISGELPEHIEFIHAAKKRFESWGYKVTIISTNTTFLHCFAHIRRRSRYPEYIGKCNGFPINGRCVINKTCKVTPIRKYLRRYPDVVQYIGIATDEPERLKRLDSQRVSLLYEYGYTENDAKQLCEKWGLLSPVYEITKRGGCWFCPNMSNKEVLYLYQNHYDLFERIVRLEQVTNTINRRWRFTQSITDIIKRGKK